MIGTVLKYDGSHRASQASQNTVGALVKNLTVSVGGVFAVHGTMVWDLGRADPTYDIRALRGALRKLWLESAADCSQNSNTLCLHTSVSHTFFFLSFHVTSSELC
jgi:hypothetical protein